jgi:hypothetical protein
MSTLPGRRSRQTVSRHPVLFLVTIALLMLSPVLGAVAQGDPGRVSPTEEPDALDSFQVNPTEEPDLPIQISPTQAPTREPIDDVVANPTREPTREPIDDVVANPTEGPTEEPIDDVVANPTETPGIDDEAIATTGTVRVVKRDCPVAIFEGDTLRQYLLICTENHDGVEFILNDVNGAQAGTTASGVIEWTGVDPGVFNITETVPAGYGDPVVFCGYTESPGGGVQHPSRQESAGGIVEGTFPDALFEFVCYWMNVPDETGFGGPDSVTNPEGDETGVADLLLTKRVCPNDIPPGQGVAYYIEHCTEIVDGIEFTVTHGNGGSTKPIADGEATWTGLPLGPFTIDEDIPVQFGEPIVFCGWTAIYEGVVYDAFSQQILPADGGLVELDVSIPGAFHFCYWFNVKGVGDLAEPGALANTLLVRKWTCPDGTLEGQRDRDYYFERCALLLEPVEFTLTNANGEETKATSGGFVEWTDVPLGEFSLEEAIPGGYTAPVFFCGWYDGFHYDAFPQLVILAVANVFEGEITIPNTDYFCDVFNIEGEIDDLHANPTEVPGIDDVVANPTERPTDEPIDDIQGNATAGTVRLIKRNCPLGVVEDATLTDYLQICSQLHDGVEFSLETSDGVDTGTTAMGQVQWTGVPSGDFEIQETIPAGYTDPIVFCGYTESPGGGVQHPALAESTGGLVGGAFPENAIFEYVCYWMNIKATGQIIPGADDVANPQGGGGTSTLTVEKRTCPFGIASNLSSNVYAEQCTTPLDGVNITVTHANGSSTKPTTGGEATWQGLPIPPYTIQEAIPGGYGDPLVLCSVLGFEDDDAGIFHSISFHSTENGAFELSLASLADNDIPEIAYTDATCTMYNIPLGPGSVANPSDLTNSLTVRKWICPGSTQHVEDQDYLKAECELSTTPVEFTLTNADGASAQATDPAWTTWDDVPMGEFTLQETIPDGFAEPIAFCEWTATYEGNIYDAFPHLVPSPGGLIEGEISVPNTSYACDVYNFSTSHTIRVYSLACPEGVIPTNIYWDGIDQCGDALAGVPFDLVTEGVTTEGVTDGNGFVEWSSVDLGASGSIQIQQETPDGYGEPIVWCVSYPVEAADAQDFEFFQAPASDGLITAQPEQHVPYTFSCHFFNIPAEAGLGGPDSVVANPQDESNTLVAHKWSCPEGAAADAHLLDYFEQCQLADTPVQFTLTNGDGESTQATAGGTAQWDDVPPGPFTLQEQIPAGNEVLVVWCGWTAFYNGAVYDAFSQPVPFEDGLANLEISVPNTHFRCDFMNVPLSIDDLQANPTDVPAIDDVQANPTEAPTEEPIDDVTSNPASSGTLIVHLWACPPGYDPLTGSAPDDCTEPQDGITFDLFNHAPAEPDFQATTGDEAAGTAVFEPQPGTYSLIEQIPDGYGEPFLWSCTGLDNPALPEPPISTINFFRIVIDSGQVIECDWMNVPAGTGFGGPGDLQANPTEATIEPIDDIVTPPTGTPSSGG